MRFRHACSLGAQALFLFSATPGRADALDDLFDDWGARAHAALSSEPHWAPPINTISPRLTQVVRYDQYWQSTGAPASIDNFDAGKGTEVIPFDTTSFTFNFPPYEEKDKKGAATGWGDWPAVLVKQRLFSAAPDDGDYVMTGYLTVQAPTGSEAFTNHVWLITPGIGFGKGWEDFDLQGCITAAFPTGNQSAIGTAIASNLTAQYHVGQYFWPEVELNDTTWSGGPRSGLNQLFMTVGAVLGNFPLFDNYALAMGGGYQFALSSRDVTAPALTPVYDHNFILTARIIY